MAGVRSPFMPFPQLSPKMIHHQLLMMLRGGCSFSNRSVTHHVNSLPSTTNQSAPEIGLFWVIGVLTSLLQGKQPPGVPASAGSPPRAWRTDVLLVGSSHLLGRGHLSTKELVTSSKSLCPSLSAEKWAQQSCTAQYMCPAIIQSNKSPPFSYLPA